MMMLQRCKFWLSVLLLFPCAAFAQAAEVAAAPQLPSMLSVFGSLILVIAAIYASVWGIRKLGQLPGASGNIVKIVGGVMVGPKERVVVVEVEGQKLVLGVANGTVNLLSKVTPQNPFEHALEVAELHKHDTTLGSQANNNKDEER